MEPCTYTPFYQCTCRRRSCSCCQLSRRLRSSLGSQTQWLTRLAKFNMGVSIYPDPNNNHTHTQTHTGIQTKRTEREEKWEDKSDYNDYSDCWRRRVRTGSSLRMRGKQTKGIWSLTEILTVTLLSWSPSVAETETQRASLHVLKGMMQNTYRKK